MLLGCLIIGGAVFFLQTRHNHGPFWYGYDEEGKGRQVVEGYRNLNHPLLNVNTAALLYRVAGSRPQPVQHAVVLGRICAAAGVALAALTLAWLAWLRAGAVAGCLTGLVMSLHPAFIHAGHFFKEDGLLVGTWGLLLLALDSYLRRPGAWSSGCAGVAAGLCASAKYIGFLPAVLGLGLLVWGASGKSRRSLAVYVLLYLAAATLVWAGINQELIAHAGRAFGRLRAEVDLLFNETSSAGPAWKILVRTSGWPGLLGLSIYFIQRFRSAQAWPRIELFALLVSGLYGVSYLLLERSAARYFLPFWLVEGWLTAVGFGLWWKSLPFGPPRRWHVTLWLILLALTYATMAQRGWFRYASYAQINPRLVMARYIDQHLPADALVVYDATVNLPDAARDQRQVDGFAPRQRLRELAPDLVTGTNILDSLKTAEVTHLVMSPRRIALFSRPDYLKVFHRDPNAALRPAFHAALQRQAEIIYSAPAGPDPILSPELTLYRLPGGEPR